MEPNLRQVVKDFTVFMVKKLGIKKPYKIKLAQVRTPDFHTLAYYNPSTGDIAVYVKNRNTADVLRSLAHEMIHHKQNQEGRLNTGEPIPDIGGPIEDEANAHAGRLVKAFALDSDHNIFD